MGAAGGFLEELLRSIGLNRQQVFIANMVKCRPPQNRDPLPEEIGACSKYLNRQIELIDPLLIVTLGRYSLARFFPGEGITRARGRLREKDGRRIYPIMHPAAGLYRQEMRRRHCRRFSADSRHSGTGPPRGGNDARNPAGSGRSAAGGTNEPALGTFLT